MGGWALTMEALVALVVLLVLPLVGLWGRRRWLSGKGGLFDCALRRPDGQRGSGWTTGVARYEGEVLQWFRIFSFSWKPMLELDRSVTSAVGSRSPEPVEAVVLFGDDQIVSLRVQGRSGEHTRELAMSPASVTGLLSWLEAAPPGGESYHNHG